ncbi:HAMP domain-containing protein [Thalassolituus maritimus]|uniref:HAMP domain-containing protein n=1 Tax=Thalassolituus maritimus TaxID=484498 RepID=A0ABP9ZZJ5_9GAMM
MSSPQAAEPEFVQKSHVGVRLLSYLLAFSFIVSLLASGFVLYSDYSRGVSQFRSNLDQINASYQESISYSLWNFDNRQIESQLAGILNFPGVVYVYIESRDKLVQSAGDIYAAADMHHSFPLTHQSASQEYQLGNLYLNVNYTGLYDDLKHKALTIIGTQFIKTFSVSIFILVMVRLLITRRLDIMAQWAHTFSLNNLDNPLDFGTPRKRPDELDMVANAINKMRETLRLDAMERERAREQLVETKEQLTVAIDNASLGFARYLPESDHLQCNNHFARHLATTRQELESMPSAMEHIRDMVRGLKGPEQREKINQLLLGRISRLHGEFTMANFRNEKCYFDITMQTLQFSESRPREVLICLLDKTREQTATRRAHELAASLENKVTERTEQLYTEQQKARETVRRLETRLEQKKAQINRQSTNDFKKWLLAEMEEHYPAGTDLPGRMPIMREYLRHSISDDDHAVDLPQLFDDILHQSVALKGVKTVTQMPFSLVVSEPSGLMKFLFGLLIDHEPMIEKASLLKATAEVRGDKAVVELNYTLKDPSEAVQEHPHLPLAEYVTSTRFGGDLTRTTNDDGNLIISLTISLDNSGVMPDDHDAASESDTDD